MAHLGVPIYLSFHGTNEATNGSHNPGLLKAGNIEPKLCWRYKVNG